MLALRSSDRFQELGEAWFRVAALEASGTEQLAKIEALENHAQELVGDNHRLEHLPLMVRIENEHHEAGDVGSTKDVTDAKVELAISKEVLRVLEGRASAKL